MTRALPLLLLLAACGGGVINESLPRDSSPEAAACRAEVERDPELRRIASSNVPDNLAQEDRVRRELREGIRRSYHACLVRHGVQAPGGVEPLRPTW